MPSMGGGNEDVQIPNPASRIANAKLIVARRRVNSVHARADGGAGLAAGPGRFSRELIPMPSGRTALHWNLDVGLDPGSGIPISATLCRHPARFLARSAALQGNPSGVEGRIPPDGIGSGGLHAATPGSAR